jgi:hypothetical protein
MVEPILTDQAVSGANPEPIGRGPGRSRSLEDYHIPIVNRRHFETRDFPASGRYHPHVLPIPSSECSGEAG